MPSKSKANLALFIAGFLGVASTVATASDQSQWAAQAARIHIVRDDLGIAHVHGKTDADAVFGMIYAQAEDDFNRIEENYLTNLGRLAEVDGERSIYQDLRQRLFYDHETLKTAYQASPEWLKSLMTAWASGLNYYLATHPKAKPRLITHFEPWMALSFTEGSIGGDVEKIPLTQLQAFYEQRPIAMSSVERLPELLPAAGSNGAAISPSRTKEGKALLLINPHTSFFFRSELQMSSDEGLNTYGAVTWGQFFVYQGFNSRAGWMHTTTGSDRVDEFALKIVRGDDGVLRYRYGEELRLLTIKPIKLKHRRPDGSMATREFTTYASHHGPVVREEGGRWIAFSMMNRPIEALQQSFLRTKAVDFKSFLKVAALQANSSNNTLYADADGVTAYLHPQFVPKRNPLLDYRKPVDGSDPSADWKGLHSLDSLPQVVSPPTGWIYNTNDWPWSAAGAWSPKAVDFPPYMDQAGPNARGLHAVQVLNAQEKFTAQTLIEAAHDSHLPGMQELVPKLLTAYSRLPADDSRRVRLAPAIKLLEQWDYRSALDSVPTTIAVVWADVLWPNAVAQGNAIGLTPWELITAGMGDADLVQTFDSSLQKLSADFGDWQVPWGKINRYQRNDGSVVQNFDDDKPSVAIPHSPGRWGALATVEARTYPGTKLRYGTSGNSFVAVAEFGPRLKAWAVSVGGESSDPKSPHFSDQIELYANGKLRPVYFYADELASHSVRQYRPGK